MTPFTERDAFQKDLETALHSQEPLIVEHQLLRSDGDRITLTGWLCLDENEDGEKIYTLFYTKAKKREIEKQKPGASPYLRALECAYQVIFQIDHVAQTVKCIHGSKNPEFGPLYDFQMTSETAKRFWLDNYIFQEDRKQMSDFIDLLIYPSREWLNTPTMQEEFRIKWINQKIYTFLGVAVQLDDSIVLLCCRNNTLHGISAVSSVGKDPTEKSPEGVTSETVPSVPVTAPSGLDATTSGLNAASSRSNVAPSGLNAASSRSNAAPSGSNAASSRSNVAPSGSASAPSDSITKSFVLADGTSTQVLNILPDPQEDEPEDAPPASTPKIPSNEIFARTFGHFDLFIHGTPVIFSGTKEKELMALLIDRNGGTLSSNEAISYLWPDEYLCVKLSNRYRKLAMKLKNTLVKYGIEHILINNHGIRSINVSAITCDCYEMLAGNEEYRKTFSNSYMVDYSWGEETLAKLWNYTGTGA
jgi:hypothetical protein